MRQHPDAAGITRLDVRGLPVVQVGMPVPMGLGNSGQVPFAPIPPAGSLTPILMPHVENGVENFLVVGAPILNGQGERVGTDLVVFRAQGLAGILGNLEEVSSSHAYLATPQARLWSADGRGSLLSIVPDPLLRIREMLREREPFYRNADFMLDTDDTGLDALSGRLIEEWKRRG
jgi:hypothetical protein